MTCMIIDDIASIKKKLRIKLYRKLFPFISHFRFHFLAVIANCPAIQNICLLVSGMQNVTDPRSPELDSLCHIVPSKNLKSNQNRKYKEETGEKGRLRLRERWPN